MTRTKSPVRLGPARWIVYGISVMAIAAVATQLYFFVMVGIYTVVNPSSTAFMRSDAWRIVQDRPDLSIQRTWVPYDQISRNLKRAIIASEDTHFVTLSTTTVTKPTPSCKPGRRTRCAARLSRVGRLSRSNWRATCFYRGKRAM